MWPMLWWYHICIGKYRPIKLNCIHNFITYLLNVDQSSFILKLVVSKNFTSPYMNMN